jgi:hypothetical protein
VDPKRPVDLPPVGPLQISRGVAFPVADVLASLGTWQKIVIEMDSLVAIVGGPVAHRTGARDTAISNLPRGSEVGRSPVQRSVITVS